MPDNLTEDKECSEKGIPRHLHTIGRLIDNDFVDTKELLYRRFPLNGGDVTQTIVFNRMSVNRGKFCLNGADDCLWDTDGGGKFTEFGVVQFPVKALDGDWAHPNNDLKLQFSLIPEHHPEKCNYPHCEVVVFEESTENPDERKPLSKLKPTSVKLAIRKHLREYIQIACPEEKSGEEMPLKL